jgi:hypothetical protein
MPSSLIVVALAAAWLIVLVPMIARKRQEVAKTADSALSARVVRSGGSRGRVKREEVTMSENLESEIGDEAPVDSADDQQDSNYTFDSSARSSSRDDRRHRPGRGGFDPQAAEEAARARYAYRQRIVVFLIAAAVLTAIVAAVVLPVLWVLHALTDIGLVGYLAYLRRQVRIENEIRQRRLARYNHTVVSRDVRASERLSTPMDDASSAGAFGEGNAPETERSFVGVERKPSPASRIRRHAVVVDLDDEDPAFHELNEHIPQTFRQAVGE